MILRCAAMNAQTKACNNQMRLQERERDYPNTFEVHLSDELIITEFISHCQCVHCVIVSRLPAYLCHTHNDFKRINMSQTVNRL